MAHDVVWVDSDPPNVHDLKIMYRRKKRVRNDPLLEARERVARHIQDNLSSDIEICRSHTDTGISREFVENSVEILGYPCYSLDDVVESTSFPLFIVNKMIKAWIESYIELDLDVYANVDMDGPSKGLVTICASLDNWE